MEDSLKATLTLCDCLCDVLSLWNKQTKLPTFTRMRSGPTACHIVTFLCLCVNFIWTRAFKSSIFSLCIYSVTVFLFFLAPTKSGYCNISLCVTCNFSSRLTNEHLSVNYSKKNKTKKKVLNFI